MTTKTEILKTIRRHCIECSGGVRTEADKCTVQRCRLHPFRFGRDPTPARGKGVAKPGPQSAVSERQQPVLTASEIENPGNQSVQPGKLTDAGDHRNPKIRSIDV